MTIARITLGLALCLVLLLPACAPADSSGGGGGGGGGGVVFAPQFALPDDGSNYLTTDSPLALNVGGTGIVRVFFKLDDVTILEDLAEPFAVAIDPAGLSEGQHKIVVRAQAASGKEEKVTLYINIDTPRISVAEIQANIDALGGGEWYEIPKTELDRVGWDEEYLGPLDAMMGAVSGGAWDTKRERLIVWGGGSGAYAGNEVYVFDLNLAGWIRLNDPAPFPPGEDNNPNALVVHPDGSPVQGHSYDTLEYVPDPVDRLIVCGRAALWGGDQGAHGLSFEFNFDTLTWTPIGESFSGSNGATAAVASDNRVWHHGARGADGNKLSVYDPAAGTWTEHDGDPGFRDSRGCATYDPVRNLFILVGNSGTEVWDLDNPDDDGVVWATTGDREIEDHNGPGCEYHAGSDRVICWNGGDVYALDLDTHVWTKIATQGTVAPPVPQHRGTRSRWRYVPSRDIFIVANSVHANVYVYRLP